jgi:hypothetical protein
MPIKQFNPSTDLAADELAKIRLKLAELSGEPIELKNGIAKLADGAVSAFGTIAAGQSFCILQYQPHSGQDRKRLEVYVFGHNGMLMKTFASEWGEKTKDGITTATTVEVAPPFARTGAELMREILRKLHT